jgi:hypothetical protein
LQPDCPPAGKVVALAPPDDGDNTNNNYYCLVDNLNICLNKLRDITTITTPPVGRLPVITEVRKFSKTLIKEVIERDVNEYASNYEWCDGIEIDIRETNWLTEKQKPVYEYKIKFKNTSMVSYKEQENLFDDIMFVHTMYFPIEESDVDCYMSVKSVYPNGDEGAFPYSYDNYNEQITESEEKEDKLKISGYDLDKIKQALQMLSQVSESVGEFVPLEFKLYGYQLRTNDFGKRLDLYIDVDKDGDVYNTMSNYWHDLSNQLLDIFEMLGIRDERYMKPMYDFKFNKRPLYNIETV